MGQAANGQKQTGAGQVRLAPLPDVERCFGEAGKRTTQSPLSRLSGGCFPLAADLPYVKKTVSFYQKDGVILSK
jgi:hypothetical protein